MKKIFLTFLLTLSSLAFGSEPFCFGNSALGFEGKISSSGELYTKESNGDWIKSNLTFYRFEKNGCLLFQTDHQGDEALFVSRMIQAAPGDFHVISFCNNQYVSWLVERGMSIRKEVYLDRISCQQSFF